MKKRTYLFSKAMAISTVAVLSGSMLTLNSCKKNDETLTEIKVQDTEDSEKTSQTELTEKYFYLRDVAKDSITKEIRALELQKERAVDSLKALGFSSLEMDSVNAAITRLANESNARIAETAKNNDANIADKIKKTDYAISDSTLVSAQRLLMELDIHNNKMDTEDEKLAKTIAENLLTIEEKQRLARVDSIKKEIEMASLLLDMENNATLKAEQLQDSLEALAANILSKQKMTAGNLQALNNLMAQIAQDSLVNDYLLEQAAIREADKLYDTIQAISLDTTGDANDLIYKAQQELYLFYKNVAADKVTKYVDSTGSVTSQVNAENKHELDLINAQNAQDLALTDTANSQMFKLMNQELDFEIDQLGFSKDSAIKLTTAETDIAIALMENLNNLNIKTLIKNQTAQELLVVKMDSLSKAAVIAELAHQEALDAIQALQMVADGSMDYLVGQSVLTVKLYEKITVNGNTVSVPFTGTATITVGGKTVTAGVADTAAWDGEYYTTVAAAGYLTTSFYANIADNLSTEDDIVDPDYELFENEIKVYLVSTAKTFDVSGIIMIDNVEVVEYDTSKVAPTGTAIYHGRDYINILSSSWGPFETQEAIDEFTYREKDPIFEDNEPYADLNMTLKISQNGNFAATNYVEKSADSDLTFSDIIIANVATGTFSAVTDANGAYAFTGIPVLNGDFDVEITWKENYLAKYIQFWGENYIQEEAEAYANLKYEVKKTNEGSISIAIDDRADNSVITDKNQIVTFIP